MGNTIKNEDLAEALINIKDNICLISFLNICKFSIGRAYIKSTFILLKYFLKNTRSFNTYLTDNFRFNEFVVSTKEDMENFIILGLRKLSGIDIIEFFNKYGNNIQDIYNITDLLKEGFLKLEGSHICIPEDKIYIMNSILNKILN